LVANHYWRAGKTIEEDIREVELIAGSIETEVVMSDSANIRKGDGNSYLVKGSDSV